MFAIISPPNQKFIFKLYIFLETVDASRITTTCLLLFSKYTCIWDFMLISYFLSTARVKSLIRPELPLKGVVVKVWIYDIPPSDYVLFRIPVHKMKRNPKVIDLNRIFLH